MSCMQHCFALSSEYLSSALHFYMVFFHILRTSGSCRAGVNLIVRLLLYIYKRDAASLCTKSQDSLVQMKKLFSF